MRGTIVKRAKKITRIFSAKAGALSAFVLAFALIVCEAYSQELVNASNNALLWVGPNALVKINGGIKLNSSSTFSVGDAAVVETTGDIVNSSGSFTTSTSTFTLGGSLYNAGNVSIGDGWFILNGSSSQTFSSTQELVFHDLILDKSGGNLVLYANVKILETLRMVTDALVDLGVYNLTIGENAGIYTDYATGQSFDENRCVSASSGTSSGALIYLISAGAPAQKILDFPLGSPGVYTPARLTFNSCTFSSGAYVAVKDIPLEHPEVNESGVSLAKYWNVSESGVAIPDNGADLLFYYDASEVNGNEGSYLVFKYAPAYPNASGLWIVEPGNSNVVLFNSDRFYSQEVDDINGDWTAGEESAAVSVYFSRADGTYTDPNVWSKQNFGGPPAATAPHKGSDIVRIKNNSITINSNIAPVKLLSVESGAALIIDGNYAVTGDTMRVEDDTRLEIAHQDGISESAASGAIQTTIRDLSSNVVYVFSGSFTQTTGDGLPDNVRSLVVDKSSSTLTLGKVLQIDDSLVINRGSLDIDNYSINGSASGRTFTMRGGELIVRNTFPVNYSPPTLTSGTITFDKDGDNTYVTIPSDASSPAAVAQYKNLVISGHRTGSSAVRLSPDGEIKISGVFDISKLRFGSAIERFVTDGSTVVFNKDGGVQEIPCDPASPADSVSYLQYYNLKIAGSGIKRLASDRNPTFVVTNDLTLESSTFSLNGFNLEVDENWTNSGGVFDPAGGAVIFYAPVQTLTSLVTSHDTSYNPFDDVTIAGEGSVRPTDDMLIRGDLVIENGAELTLSSGTSTSPRLEIRGDWINQGGSFTPGSSTVTFYSGSSQTMSSSGGSETFYYLVVDNGDVLDASNVGPNSDYGVIVRNTLDLSNGVLKTRGRYAKVLGAILRNGANAGFVDGALRKSVSAGSSTITYEVGYNKSYTPVRLAFAGSGGDDGFLSVMADTITASSSPISTSGGSLSPAGSNLLDSKNVRRQWIVSVPSSSSFSLGSDRTYDIRMYFIAGTSPNGDLRGGADASLFETRLLNGSDWIGPDRWGEPRTGNRGSNYTDFEKLSQFGAFTISEPEHYSFYSISSGSWSEPSNWSTQHYFGSPSSVAPTNDSYVYIGNSSTITLYSDKTVNGKLIVDSLGTLLCGDYRVSGTGEFYLYPEGAIGTSDADGFASAGSVGAIRTSSRDYNYNSRDRGHFIFTGGVNDQSTGDGMPSVVATLTVNKTGGSRVRLDHSVIITDSLSIASGVLYAREPATANATDIFLEGNLNITSSGTFDPYQGEFKFMGDTTQVVTAKNDIKFYDLTIRNDAAGSKIWFKPTASGTSHKVEVENELMFTPVNKAYIDLSPTNSTLTSFPSYNSGEWYMTMDQGGAGVVRLGEGHISGELRKWIDANDITEAMFEVGHDSVYAPFALDFDNSGGTAGYVGVQVIPFYHPESDYLDDASYNYQQERMVKKYWRLTMPASSSFDRGGRDMAMRCRYRDPEDIPGGALKLCFDLTYWTGPNHSDWERLSPPNSGAGVAEYNDGSGAYCGERSIMNDEATYSPVGTDTSTTAYNIDSSIPLGSYDLGLGNNNRYLLADVVVAQQGPGLQYYYSRQDGAWNDPNTWSTESYTSSVNSTNSWPKRRLDIAKIGDGHTVYLNCNIGAGYPAPGGAASYREQRLGSIIVEETSGGPGKLVLGPYQIRASVFELHSGGILSTGLDEGFPLDLNRGNLIRELQGTTIARDLNYSNHNNGNFIFTAKGKVSETWDNGSSENYCDAQSVAWLPGGAYIDDIYVDNGSSYTAPNVFEYLNNGIQRNSNTSVSDLGFRYFCDTTIRLTAGNTYTMRIHVNGSGGSTYYCRLWIDTDFDGTYDDPGERHPSSQQLVNGAGNADITFTIPANTDAGVTRLRIQLREYGAQGPCYAPGWWYEDGEVEDYTVYITNNSQAITQETGDGLPDQVSSITINTAASSGTVTQTQGISVADTFAIENGTYVPITEPNNMTELIAYQFRAASGSYQEITDGTAPSLSSGDADDGYYANIPIGFTFYYLGNSYTTLSANTNGIISFGGATTSASNDLENNGGGARPIIAPLWDDLDMSSGQFSYKTIGTAPGRIFIAQWQNVEWNASAAGPVISFQVRLYEATGEIRFVYSTAPNSVNSGSASIGLTAAATGNYNFVSLSSASGNPSLSYTTSTNNISSKPANGQVYRFIPPYAILRLD